MLWEYEEELLLIDLYNYTNNHTTNENSIVIEELSCALNKRAKKLGYEVEETFRNTTGIKMKLLNIEYLASDGKYGLSAYSKMDEKCYKYFLNKPNDFESEVILIKRKYAISY